MTDTGAPVTTNFQELAKAGLDKIRKARQAEAQAERDRVATVKKIGTETFLPNLNNLYVAPLIEGILSILKGSHIFQYGKPTVELKRHTSSDPVYIQALDITMPSHETPHKISLTAPNNISDERWFEYQKASETTSNHRLEISIYVPIHEGLEPLVGFKAIEAKIFNVENVWEQNNTSENKGRTKPRISIEFPRSNDKSWGQPQREKSVEDALKKAITTLMKGLAGELSSEAHIELLNALVAPALHEPMPEDDVIKIKQIARKADNGFSEDHLDDFVKARKAFLTKQNQGER